MFKCNQSFKFLKAKAFLILKAASDSNSGVDLKEDFLIDNKFCYPLSESDIIDEEEEDDIVDEEEEDDIVNEEEGGIVYEDEDDIVEEFPYSITARETIIKANGDVIGSFEIGPLEVGQGVTLGNTLRRVILGTLTGSAITSFRINDAKHEFSVIKNIKEDILEIASNLKTLRFKAGALNEPVLGYALITGPQIVTGGMLRFPQKTAKILNADQYICTITNGTAVLEVEVSGAAHYERFSDITDDKNSIALNLITTNANPMFISLDANFSSVKAVSYKVKLGHDQFGILSDIVEFSVTTNGACSPLRAILEGAKEILELFYPLVLSSKIIKEAVSAI